MPRRRSSLRASGVSSRTIAALAPSRAPITALESTLVSTENCASASLISEINNRNPKSKKRKMGQMATNSLYNHLQIPPTPRDRPSAISTNPDLGVNQKPKPSRCTARGPDPDLQPDEVKTEAYHLYIVICDLR